MIIFLRAFFGFLDKLAGYFRDKQLIDAGKAEAKIEAVKEVEANVAKAEAAVAVPDHVRTERLRSQFDRSRRPE